MKNLYPFLIVIVVFSLFAPLAVAKPPSWDDQINNSGRFKVLSELGGAGVLDKETGLVWVQSPRITGGPFNNGSDSWFNALTDCYTRTVGGRKGWRLPTIEELASLVDQTHTNPALPANHPFSNVQSDVYWSATTSAGNTGNAWGVDFNNGIVSNGDKTGFNFFWCVRGGQGIDGVQ